MKDAIWVYCDKSKKSSCVYPKAPQVFLLSYISAPRAPKVEVFQIGFCNIVGKGTHNKRDSAAEKLSFEYTF